MLAANLVGPESGRMQSVRDTHTTHNLIVRRMAWLLPILLLAVVTRFWGIDDQSLWIDEGFT